MIDERRRQAALDAMGVLDTPPDERVDRVARLAQEMFGVPMVSVSLIDRDRQWRKSQIGLDGPEAPREESFCDYTVTRNELVVVEDATTTPDFAENPFVIGEPHLRFYAGYPLHAPGGEPVGTLCIVDTQPHAFDEHHAMLLRDLAFWVQTELTRELDITQAEVVQRSLTPTTLPQVPGYTVAAAAAARSSLTGDFYDVSLHGDVLRVTVADAMGKGIGPALVAASVRGSLRTEPGRPLAQAIAEADRLLAEDFGDAGMFVTAVHADIDVASGRIDYVDAGHGLAFIVRANGEWEALRSVGLPIGMGVDVPDERESATAQLEPGDSFICCSDGLLDVLDADDPFAHVIGALRDLGPHGAVAEAMRLARSDQATDDVTALVVRRAG